MDFKELVYILTVADLRNVTAAANHLFISQPSLSQTITKIESDIGVKLFDRTANPITLTRAGEIYIEHARSILNMSEDLTRQLSDLHAGYNGRLSFGIPIVRAGYMLPPVVAAFREQYPHIEIVPLEARSRKLLERVKKRELRFAILPDLYPELVPYAEDFTYQYICEEELVLVCPQPFQEPGTTPGGTLPSIRLLDGLSMITLDHGHTMSEYVKKLFRDSHMTLNSSLTTASNLNALELVRAGHGAAILPMPVLHISGEDEKTVYYKLPAPYHTWKIHAYYLKDCVLNSYEQCFIDLMKAHSGQA